MLTSLNTYPSLSAFVSRIAAPNRVGTLSLEVTVVFVPSKAV